MSSQGTKWDHLGHKKAPVGAGTGCWHHQLALVLEATARNAGDGQSVPNSHEHETTLNIQLGGEKNGFGVIALFKHTGLDFGLCLGCNAL